MKSEKTCPHCKKSGHVRRTHHDCDVKIQTVFTTQSGLKRCSNKPCGKWESQPREFAKCRHCRVAKYCSKACQDEAWTKGHGRWCVKSYSSFVSFDKPKVTSTTTDADKD